MGGESVAAERETRMWLSKKFRNDLIVIWLSGSKNIKIGMTSRPWLSIKNFHMKYRAFVYLRNNLFYAERTDLIAEEV